MSPLETICVIFFLYSYHSWGNCVILRPRLFFLACESLGLITDESSLLLLSVLDLSFFVCS